jgi:hypothetical protein
MQSHMLELELANSKRKRTCFDNHMCTGYTQRKASVSTTLESTGYRNAVARWCVIGTDALKSPICSISKSILSNVARLPT